MAMHPLPPQAYTKETLLTAYTWLQNQAPNIREMATTPDILVSLFLKATRDGDRSLERPSIQNFKNELKSLAGLMGELENPPTQQNTAAQAHAQIIAQSLGLTAAQSQLEPIVASTASLQELDSQSREMIREVKNQLNLSSESDALRAIIRLGHLQISRLFR